MVLVSSPAHKRRPVCCDLATMMITVGTPTQVVYGEASTILSAFSPSLHLILTPALEGSHLHAPHVQMGMPGLRRVK